ncbi:hypothetical protein CQ12_25260 [Bradyrhizobium jicamae]|uniref:Uncharacterized protein n=1 Tax=Bradyrhizobium jicamae TaxID=280332 RepID=A0A0R3LJG4_9BRAD|nr:hypothetical protein CQ12_25260 [Bradyrhizobium jicamae]
MEVADIVVSANYAAAYEHADPAIHTPIGFIHSDDKTRRQRDRSCPNARFHTARLPIGRRELGGAEPAVAENAEPLYVTGALAMLPE